MQENKYTTEKIIAIKKYTDKVMTFTISRPESYRFSAGQFSRLGFVQGSGYIWRAYSIVSAEYEEVLEYYIILIENGQMSQYLQNIQLGDPILLDKTVTGFLLPERFIGGEQLIMLSTGSGIAPFLSQLKTESLWQRFKTIILVHSVSYLNELVSIELVAELLNYPLVAQYQAQFTFIPVLTRETDSQELSARIPELIKNGVLEQKLDVQFNPEQSRFMICGNPSMVNDTFKVLLSRGFAMHRNRIPGQIIMENGF